MQTKTLKGGTGDEISIARHREVSLCSIGSIAFYLFAQEFLGGKPIVPPVKHFVPGIDPAAYKEWYDIALFQSRKQNNKRKRDNQNSMDLENTGIALKRGITYESEWISFYL